MVVFGNSKSQILNSKQAPNGQITSNKRYDLEERCFAFAKKVDEYVLKLPKTIPNVEHGRQLVKSGGSVGANYIEANESLSKKDFIMRVKISKKETKESRFWLRLTVPLPEQEKAREQLIDESLELMKIFGSILERSK